MPTHCLQIFTEDNCRIDHAKFVMLWGILELCHDSKICVLVGICLYSKNSYSMPTHCLQIFTVDNCRIDHAKFAMLWGILELCHDSKICVPVLAPKELKPESRWSSFGLYGPGQSWANGRLGRFLADWVTGWQAGLSKWAAQTVKGFE
jgi:hypothetical protein